MFKSFVKTIYSGVTEGFYFRCKYMVAIWSDVNTQMHMVAISAGVNIWSLYGQMFKYTNVYGGYIRRCK